MEDERISPEEYLRRLEMSRLEAEGEEAAKEQAAEPAPEQNTKPKTKKKKRKKKHYLLRFCIVLAIIGGAFYALQSSLFYLKTIEVEGNRFYTPSQVIEMSGLETGKNMFFEIRTKNCRDNLLQSPYIAVAEIKRVPPGTIKISLTERLEYAAIPYDGSYVLIDKDGTVLSISNDEPSLPLLEGMEIEEMSPGFPLKIKQAYLLNDTMQLLGSVDDTDLYFKRIYFSTVLVRAYINDNYYCEGTPSDIAGNIENIRKLIEEQYKQGVSKGVIRIGSDGYFSFSPKID